MTAAPDNMTVPQASPLARLAGWHLVWAVAVLVGGLAVNSLAGGLTLGLAVALGAGLLPGLYVLVMKPFDGDRARLGLLALWAICGAVAAVVTGGIGGPMAAWCLAPLAVCGVLDRPRCTSLAAALSVLSVIAVVFVQVTGHAPAAPEGLVAFVLGLTAITTLAIGVGAGIVIAHRRAQTDDEAILPLPPHDTSAPDPLGAYPGKILVIEPDGAIAAVFGRLVAVAPAVGETFTLIARPEDRQVLAAAAATTRTDGVQTVGFVPAAWPEHYMTLDLSPLENGRLVGVVRDATATRDREDSLELARADAENLAAGRARFLAGMSHELRTPLNAIMGFSDIMKNRMFGDLPGKYAEYAELIHESGAHLLDLINDVLDMSKIEAHRYELNTEFMDAREPVSAALRILRVQADDAGVKLRATLPSQPIEVEADRRAIKQIVINLVSNALKFTPRDGSVIVGLIGRGKDLELTVADTGIGIAESDLDRLGKPYEQVGDAARKSKGTGLGLSLVRAFAELHGGQMVIESRLGEGTAVTVTMPVVVQDEAKKPPESANVVAFKPQR